MISKIEGELKRKFGVELKRQAPDFLSLRYETNGGPDREVVGLGKTTRWEFKHATPDFRSPGDQELTCARLAAIAHCRYVIWTEDRDGTNKRTWIVHPREVLGKKGKSLNIVRIEDGCREFDMQWLVQYVLKEHGR